MIPIQWRIEEGELCWHEHNNRQLGCILVFYFEVSLRQDVLTVQTRHFDIKGNRFERRRKEIRKMKIVIKALIAATVAVTVSIT
jgi:hypothetical protein